MFSLAPDHAKFPNQPERHITRNQQSFENEPREKFNGLYEVEKQAESPTRIEQCQTISNLDRTDINTEHILDNDRATKLQTPGPPPDGGLAAWIQVLMTHIVIFNTWGYINSFGVFQVYYVQHLNRPASDISWVGSVQIFLLFSIGTFSGRASDAGYFKHCFAMGLAVQLFGVFMTSLCTTYWQLFLAQGICTGVGNGLLFCPSLAVLTTYFLRRRGVAVGLAACGTATGGVVLPLLAQHLLPKLGFAWTIRVLGFIMLGSMMLPLFFMRSRLPPRPTGPWVDWAAFKELPYLFFAIGNSTCFLGLYFAVYYVRACSSCQKLCIPKTNPFQISAFAVTTFSITTEKSFTVLIILNPKVEE
jgi:MFS family permease